MSSLQTIFERKLTSTFPEPHQRKKAFSIFPPFEDLPENMRYRVWLAILKLSESDMNKLAQTIEAAIEDPEDTIEWAERPFSWQAKMTIQSTTSDSPSNDIRDWTQYVTWLL